MQLLWLRFVQFYLTIGFKFYYKKFNAIYLEEVPKDKAVIYLSNHQNALLDPLLITIKSTRKNYFLTRAAVFKNPSVAKILNSLQMLPVYRMIDGVDIRKKNKEIFTKSAELLHKKKSIILFPEGSHDIKRRVRPLKKGFSRIIEETLQKYPKTDIVIIPIGVNYQSPTEYGDEITVYFGNHISAKEFWNDNNLDFNGISNAVTIELKKLTTHIDPLNEYEEKLNKLKQLNVDFTNPVSVNDCISKDFEYSGEKKKSDSKLYSIFKALVKTFYFVPYLIWKKMAFPKVKELEFVGTFRYALIITLAPIFLLITVLTLSVLFGKTIGLTVLLIGILLPLLTLRLK